MILMGPVPCGDCRRPVALVVLSRRWLEWRDATPTRQRGYFGHRVSRHSHRCPAIDRRKLGLLDAGRAA